ncbi:MAG: hypothetical protein IJ684_00945 [Bacteroidales bacterium]|nr:hypothetical protein [Bacteroidales bacterium]
MKTIKAINRIVVPMLCVVGFVSCRPDAIIPGGSNLYIENHTSSNVRICGVQEYSQSEHKIEPNEKALICHCIEADYRAFSWIIGDNFGDTVQIIFDDTLAVTHITQFVTSDSVVVLPNRHSLYSNDSYIQTGPYSYAFIIDSADYAAATRIEDDDDGLQWK